MIKKTVFIIVIIALLTGLILNVSPGYALELDSVNDKNRTPMADITDIIEKSGSFDYHLTYLDPKVFLAEYMEKLKYADKNQLISRDPDGKINVSIYLPDPSVAQLAERAEKLAGEGYISDALKTVGEIRKIDPEYWKADLLEGLAYYAGGDYRKALDSARLALEKNRADFEAHLLEGRCREKLNEPDKARQSYILAIIYNRNSKDAWECLENLGKKAGFSLYREPFIPLYNTEKMPNGKTRIYLDKDTAYRWMPYAFNRAVFMHYPGYFKKRTGLDEYKRTLTEEMESLQNTIWSYKAFRGRGNIPADPFMERLLTVSERFYLKQYALFEVLSPENPEILSACDESGLLDLLDYINDFIIIDAVRP